MAAVGSSHVGVDWTIVNTGGSSGTVKCYALVTFSHHRGGVQFTNTHTLTPGQELTGATFVTLGLVPPYGTYAAKVTMSDVKFTCNP